ncbi:MAG TPA: cupin domain-containing protein [Candidatus Sulfopaludibacter sp.]|jgi:quercetin dioxygenase-like cupin family protein|nr:cupin domain-containing protein [Candidatus Sulfopaludibacter sp.]
MQYSRRDLALILPALTAAGAAAQDQKKSLASKVFTFEELPVKVNGQNKSRAVLNGELHSGFPVELHITELGPGQVPHQPHKHENEEIVMLRSGQLDITINGQTTRATAGSVIYVASNEEHGSRNPGPDPAMYFVIALGKKA